MPKPVQQAESSRTHLERSLKLAEESKQIGVNTLVKLDEQTEQMRRIKADAEDTEHIIKGNRGVVKDMRRSWLVRLCCYNRTDILPDDVEWSNRDTPEEQMRVKKMIKLDKRRRKLRRLQRKKDGQPGAAGADQEDSDDSPTASGRKSSSWRFWKKRGDSDDSSDLSDISEEDLPVEKPRKQAAPKVNPKLIPDVGKIEFEDEESGLDQLHNTIQDLKVIALQISETGQQQTAALAGISEQVNKNQDQLDRNNQLIGKLGKRAKDDGDDGILSAQDRLAIMGVKSALSARMN
jgi:hypothetical protein